MAAWPSTLPVPLASGYGIAPMDPTLRTDMEAGMPRVRRRTSARNDRITLSWIMSDAQAAIYRSWFDVDIAGGASWFTVDLALATGGLVPSEARFTKPPALAHLGRLKWQVSGEVEVR